MTPDPATLLAAAAIIDARAANGHPEWARIADDLTRWAADMATTSVRGPQGGESGLDGYSDILATYEARRAAQ